MKKVVQVYETDLLNEVKLAKKDDVCFEEDKTDTTAREDRLINIYDEVNFQEILGFGGALTEATAINVCDMPKELHEKAMEMYFDKEKGIGYSFCRSTINSCDFSADFYSYDDVENDYELENFDIEHDRKQIIPVIKEAFSKAEELRLFCSPWSPPAWMKTNGKMSKGGMLKEDCYGAWAKYFGRFIEEYEKEGINIWGFTVQNEPKAEQGWESCYYRPEDERRFVDEYLNPVLTKMNLTDKKVICWDHNKERVVDRAMEIIGNSSNPQNVDGVAVHWYSGDHFRALEAVHMLYPDKYIISSEQCTGKSEEIYRSGERYAHDIIGNMSNWANAWVDWNMILDEDGSPDHWKDEQHEMGIPEDKIWVGESPIVYDRENEQLDVRSSYYYMGHFSKFVRPHAKRIASSCFDDELEVIAFINPDNTKVCVVLNRSEKEKEFAIRYKTKLANSLIKPHSIRTFIW